MYVLTIPGAMQHTGTLGRIDLTIQKDKTEEAL